MASRVLLERAWPDAYQEAMMLIHLIRCSTPSLADVLALGLISVLTPAARKPSADVQLSHKRAVLSGVARREAGSRVVAPHTRPGEVTHIEVVDLAVAGRSCMGLTG